MEFISNELLSALHDAKLKAARKASRLHVDADGQTWRVLRRWEGGFSLDAKQVQHLRGLVDLYDGPRQIAQCLIVASEIVGGELICATKRETAVTGFAPVDYVREKAAQLLIGAVKAGPEGSTL